MVKIAKKLFRRERERLQRKTEEAKMRGGVSASLFLEEDMNAIENADCFFFYGGRICPKALLTVFFPDEEHAEITVAKFTAEKKMLPVLYKKALAACKRVGIEQVHTVKNPVLGFDLESIDGIAFMHDWSEYMLCNEMRVLAEIVEQTGQAVTEIKKEEASEGDGTLRYVLVWNGTEAAECRIFSMDDGRQCYLFGLKTKEEFRRRGMATLLLSGIAKEYAEIENSVMRLQVSSKNVPAERLYRKLGFRTEEEREYYKTEVIPDGK